MKLIGLILSAVVLMGATSCQSLDPFPEDPLYIPDLANGVCAEYEIVDRVNIKLRLTRELPLIPKGPCDRMAGWSRTGFKNVQNWVRDAISAGVKSGEIEITE